LVYPSILLVLSCIVVAIIVLRVVPEFGAFYAQFGRELPLSTRIIVSVSNFAVAYFFIVLLSIVALVSASIAWLRTPGNRRRFDKWLLGIPAVGSIAQKFATSQAARTLATLLGGGIPLVNAIDVSARSIGNQYMAQELTTAAQQVREGRALASAMMLSGAFPDVSIKMVEVGESTGALQEMLNSLSEFYDEEIETSLTRFITIVEPALLVIMGLIIAALLLSLYMPLFNLSSMIS
jgi:type IV pilus assembly protein PilC